MLMDEGVQVADHEEIIELINSRFDSQDDRILDLRSEVTGGRGEIANLAQSVVDLKLAVVHKTDCASCATRFVDKRWASGVIAGFSALFAVLGVILVKIQDLHEWLDQMSNGTVIH